MRRLARRAGSTVALALALLVGAPGWPSAHPGGMDSDGCHHDRSRGGYHCHRGAFAGQSFASREEFLRQRGSAPGPSTTAPPARSLEARVVRVVDGDTIQVRVEGRTERVRYIGMDTPETKHPTRGEEPGGREATEVNRRLVEGRAVRLEFDVQERDR